MSRVIAASRANGIYALDGVYNDASDRSGYHLECQEGKALGFAGKLLIHPSQLPLANSAFQPSEEEVQWAQRVMTAIDESEGGVATVDGRMVEELHARRAREVTHRATACREADKEALQSAALRREVRGIVGDDLMPKRSGLDPPPPPPRYE